MIVTQEQINSAKKRYEEHFKIPFPKDVLFHIGNPNNIENADELFQEDLDSVEEAIRSNQPFDEKLLKTMLI